MKMYGKGIMWCENGQMQAEVESRNGKEVRSREWDEEGNQINCDSPSAK